MLFRSPSTNEHKDVTIKSEVEEQERLSIPSKVDEQLEITIRPDMREQEQESGQNNLEEQELITIQSEADREDKIVIQPAADAYKKDSQTTPVKIEYDGALLDLSEALGIEKADDTLVNEKTKSDEDISKKNEIFNESETSITTETTDDNKVQQDGYKIVESKTEEKLKEKEEKLLEFGEGQQEDEIFDSEELFGLDDEKNQQEVEEENELIQKKVEENKTEKSEPVYKTSTNNKKDVSDFEESELTMMLALYDEEKVE